MLPASHYRAYQAFLTLLIEFNYLLNSQKVEINQNSIKLEFEHLKNFYEKQIVTLREHNIESNIVNRWQSIQRELQREFKLLSTGILFLISAQTKTTRQKKLNNIKQNTTKLIGYCQVMSQKD